ncbi:MAG: hypothetical protein KDI68_08815 [Gammaproteobacteria bacterium]|nr:hypothetical protein [Gammaproteobacteria bacterium]
METTIKGILCATALLSGSATAAVQHVFDWTGILTITGFSPSGLNNPDGITSTMRFEWVIDDDSSFTIGPAVTGPVTVEGNFTILNFLGPGTTRELPVEVISVIADELPPGSATFPPGVTPKYEAHGNPVVAVPFVDPGSLIDSTMNITDMVFDGNVLTYDLTEVVNPGGFGSLAFVFASMDGAISGIPDGSISRPFDLNVTVSAVPIPAAVWLMGSAVLGLIGFGRRSWG